MAKIVITDSRGQQSTVELEQSRRYGIGRSANNEVVLMDPALSRRHAEIYFENGSWTIADRQSSNGTFLDGQRLTQPAVLDPDKTIALGGCTLGFSDDRPRSATPERLVLSDRPLMPQGTVMLSTTDLMSDTETSGAELEAMRRRLGIVERANLELLVHEPMDVLLPKILDLVFEAVRPDRAALLRKDDDGELIVRAFRGGDRQGMSISRTIARTVLDERVSVLTADAQSDLRFAEGASVAIQGIRAVMAVPLWNKKEVIGLIYADSRLASHEFKDEDLKLLTMLANVAAIQIENARLFREQVEIHRFEREAQAAAEIQTRLLPTEPPTIPGYRFAGDNTPCHEVGGDYFDCLPLDEQRRSIILADVAGKGMGAALLMAGIQATFHARVESGAAPDRLVGQLNDAVVRNAPINRFATVFLIDLDVASHRLRAVNAGHAPHPLLVRASGEVLELPSGGPPVGIFAGFDYPMLEQELGPGDFVFVCSDGVTDVEDPDEEQFGDERLKELVASLAGRAPDEVRRTIEEQLEAHAQGTRRPDDLTIVIVQREP